LNGAKAKFKQAIRHPHYRLTLKKEYLGSKWPLTSGPSPMKLKSSPKKNEYLGSEQMLLLSYKILGPRNTALLFGL
jgi:hypothetical protein